MKQALPKVSIGLIVYNGAATLRVALDSILNQTFTDFELIISDNASTDGTENICREYAYSDKRIDYIRQPMNIGIHANLLFVCGQAVAEYFMWAAADDSRSCDAVQACVNVLSSDSDCVFAGTPDCSQGQEADSSQYTNYSLCGDLYTRLKGFMNVCMHSHGMFWALMRRENLVTCVQKSSTLFLAHDWSINVHMLLQGTFRRTSAGLLMLGGGASSQPGFLKTMRTRRIERVIPFYSFSKIFLASCFPHKHLSIINKLSLFFNIINFNMRFGVERLGVVRTVRYLYLDFYHHVLPALLRRDKPLGTGQPIVLSRRFVKWWNSD